MTTQRIVVGVDGSASARAAVGWAADEAALRGCALLLLHAPTRKDDNLVRRYGEPALRALDSVAAHLLDELSVYASVRQPSVAVTSRITHAHAADALVDLSDDAALTAVGTRGTGSLDTLLGSVSRHVAAHAHGPVAVIPERPAFRTVAAASGGYLVSELSGTAAGQSALRYAFDEAMLHDISVVAVSGLRDGTDQSEPRSGAGSADPVAMMLAPFARTHPSVPVSPLALGIDPGQALLEAGQHAQMIVLGCDHSDDHWSTRLGPVASTVLHRTPCPVVVIGHGVAAASAFDEISHNAGWHPAG